MYHVARQLTGMVETGSLLSSLPDRPLPIAIVERLEEHDAIVVAVPIQTEDEKRAGSSRHRAVHAGDRLRRCWRDRV